MEWLRRDQCERILDDSVDRAPGHRGTGAPTALAALRNMHVEEQADLRGTIEAGWRLGRAHGRQSLSLREYIHRVEKMCPVQGLTLGHYGGSMEG